MDVKGRASGARGRRATLREVAAEVGVSPATVSNAYNRPDQLSTAMRERVFEAARRLGYPGPDPTARSLRRGRSGVIGVLYADRLSYAFEDPAAVLFLRGVSEAAEEAGLQLLLITGSVRGEGSAEAVGAAAVDGFIVYSMPEDDPSVDAVLDRRLPTVLVDQPETSDAPLVGINDREAARAAAEHLVSLGHRRIGVISFELAREPVGGFVGAARQEAATFLASGQRLRGYAEAVEPAGIPWRSVPVYECAENVLEEGRAAATALLAPGGPTAILAMSDLLAFGVLEAASEMGLAVPGDLSVVGFDDVPEAARARPPLTTVHQPHIEKGLKAGRLLVSQLHGESPARGQVLPTRFVVRESTAPPRTDA